jgi:hypothetical protein
MSMRFRYKHIRTGRLIPSLGGRTVRPRPLIDILLIGPADNRVRPALLDTGADDTIFSDSLAGLLGVDLSNAQAGSASMAGAGAVLLRYADVMLRLTDGREWCEWQATVGFTPTRLVHPILGFAGCLQFFLAAFEGDREEVELTANSLYRGRQGSFGDPGQDTGP